MPRSEEKGVPGKAAAVRRTVNLGSAYSLVLEECRIQDPDEKPNIEKMNRVLIREAITAREKIREGNKAQEVKPKHAESSDSPEGDSDSGGRHIVNISRESRRLIEAECKQEEPTEKPNISRMNRKLVREAVAARKITRKQSNA